MELQNTDEKVANLRVNKRLMSEYFTFFGGALMIFALLIFITQSVAVALLASEIAVSTLIIYRRIDKLQNGPNKS